MPDTNTKGEHRTDPLLFGTILRTYKEDRSAIINRKLPEMWEKYENQYGNEYWTGDNQREDHLSEMTSNSLFEVVESELPVITARAPKPDVTLLPIMLDEEQLEAARNYAGKVQRELNTIWSDNDDNDMQQIVQSGFREHEIKGKMVIHSEYSFQDQKIVTEIADLYSIVPDRHADSIEACHKTHLSYATYRTPAWIMEKHGVQVEAEGFFDDDSNFSFYSNRKILERAASFAINVIKGMFSEESADKHQGYCLYIKYYCSGKVLVGDKMKELYQDHDYDDDGTIKKTPAGEKMTVKQEKEKYPNGRIITIVRNHKDVILRDKANIYPRYPFFETTNYKRAGDFWGTSEGLNFEMHTMALNLIISNTVDNIRYTGNPQRVVTEGGETEDMPVEPGTTVKQSMPGGTDYLIPPPLQNVSWFLEWLQLDIDRKSGWNDPSRGMANPGDSGVKVRAEISQAVGRLQPKTAEFLTLARKLFNYWIFIIQNFYPDEVVQEVIDEATGESIYEPFNPREGANLKLKVKIGNTAMLPADTFGEFEEGKYFFELGMNTYGFPLISPEHLVELAPSLADQQRVKTWMKQKFAEAEAQAQVQAQAEEQAQAGPQPTEEEMIAMQNAQADGNKDAVIAILEGMKERFMAENAPLPPEAEA